MKSLALISFVIFTTVVSRADGITPISSSVNLMADANAGIGSTQAEQSVSQMTSLTSLYSTVSATALNGTLNATAESDATATWSSATDGQFSLHDSFTSSDLSAYAAARVATGGSSWIYTFNSVTPATLTLDYSVSSTGSNPYMTLLFVNQMTGDTLQDDNLVKQVSFDTPPTSGTVAFSLAPGVDYTFSIFDDSNLNQNFPAFSLDMNAIFSFHITPVPEPSTYAFALLIALITLLSRKNRAWV